MADVAYVSNNGLGLITELLAASSHKYVGWGTGTTAAAVGNTALETAASESRTSGTQTQQTTTTTNDTYQVVAQITCAGSGKAITEVGVFSASTDGTLFLRATHDAINVSVGDSITYTIKVVLDQA
jgi:hypothetical protein